MTTPDPAPTGPTAPAPPGPPEPRMGGPAYDDDLVEELRARGRARPPTVTVVLAAALLLAIGFVGGTQAQRAFGRASAASARASAPAGVRASGGPYAGGFPGRGGLGRGGGATSGTVKLVDGDTLYVRDGSGRLVKVKVTGSTTVRITKPGKVSQLEPGQQVVAQGTKGADGTVTATTISSGGARGGGGGRQGPD